MPEGITGKPYNDNVARTNVYAPIPMNQDTFVALNESGIDISNVHSHKDISDALTKAEQKGQIIFGMEILGIILVILAAFLWLRKKRNT